MGKFEWPFKSLVYRTAVSNKKEEPEEFMLEIYKRPEDLYNGTKPHMIIKGFDDLLDLNDSMDEYF